MKRKRAKHGGARPGSGRKLKQESEKRRMISVRVFPKTNPKWAELARKAGVSKGKIIDWLVGDSPEAEICRLAIVEGNRKVRSGLGKYFA